MRHFCTGETQAGRSDGSRTSVSWGMTRSQRSSGDAGRVRLLGNEGWSLLSLLKLGVWEIIWLFEGTFPLSDPIGSSSTAFIRVSRNFGTTEDTEEADGKRSFAAASSGCYPGSTIFFSRFLTFPCELNRIKQPTWRTTLNFPKHSRLFKPQS